MEPGCSENSPLPNREKKRQEGREGINGEGEYSERSSLNLSNESIGKTKFSRAEQIFKNLKQKMTRTDALHILKVEKLVEVPM
jgi:hypothetical protein